MTNIIFLFCSLLFVFDSLSGLVQDHLKPIGQKENPEMHRMRNVDFIYIINLDHQPGKLKYCLDQLEPHGIHPFRFSAIYGKELPLSVINDVGVKYEPWMAKGIRGSYYPIDGDGSFLSEVVSVVGRVYFSCQMRRAPIAITLSHLSVLQDAYDSGYETIWVMEDDIQVLRDPHLISTMIDKLDAVVGPSWDILFTDQDTKSFTGEYITCFGFAEKPNFNPKFKYRFSLRYDVSEDFRRIGARYGAYSMIMRRSGIKKILEFIKKYQIFLPYDMEYHLPNDIQLYTVIEDIVSTMPGAPSDNI